MNNIKGRTRADLYPGDSRSSPLFAKLHAFHTVVITLSTHALGLMSKLIRGSNFFDTRGASVLVLSWQEAGVNLSCQALTLCNFLEAIGSLYSSNILFNTQIFCITQVTWYGSCYACLQLA